MSRDAVRVLRQCGRILSFIFSRVEQIKYVIVKNAPSVVEKFVKLLYTRRVYVFVDSK